MCIGCISLVPTKLVDFLCKLLQTKVKQVVQGEEEKYQDTDKIMILEISKEIKKGKNISHYKSIFIGVLENWTACLVSSSDSFRLIGPFFFFFLRFCFVSVLFCPFILKVCVAQPGTGRRPDGSLHCQPSPGLSCPLFNQENQSVASVLSVTNQCIVETSRKKKKNQRSKVMNSNNGFLYFCV